MHRRRKGTAEGAKPVRDRLIRLLGICSLLSITQGAAAQTAAPT